jgi:invasion protein IalB
MSVRIFLVLSLAVMGVFVTQVGAAGVKSLSSSTGDSGPFDMIGTSVQQSANSGLGTPANTTEDIGSRFGDWQVQCETPKGATTEQCAAVESVTASDQPEVGLTVIVLKSASTGKPLLRILAPLGVLLSKGLGLNIDNADMGSVGFIRCVPTGCVAEVTMDESLLGKLQSGRQAVFSIFKTPSNGFGIPVSLDGFTEALKALG